MENQWREKLGIEIGMTKDQALEKFIDWQQNKKTCQRCEGDKYVDYCPIHLICEEAQNERDAKGFQSKLPCGERPRPPCKRWMTEGFNPRSRAGSDQIYLFPYHMTHWFQSTLPCGERRLV